MTAAFQHRTTGPAHLSGSRFASCRHAQRFRNTRPAKRAAGRKTASRIFFRAPSKPRRELLPQVTGTHLESRSYRYVFAPGCVVAPNSTTPNSTSAWQLGVQWLTGTGPRVQNFSNGDPLTQTLQQHSWIQGTRDLIGNNIANGGPLEGDNNYNLGGLQGVPKYLKDYSTLATGGLTGNLAVTYLGSYALHYEVTDINLDNQTATVNFHVTNDSTINSATHPPVIGYTQTWNTYIGTPLNNFFASGPMSWKYCMQPRLKTFGLRMPARGTKRFVRLSCAGMAP